MAEYIDVVSYRDEPDPWNGLFIENEHGEQVKIGTWLDSDESDRRVLRIQANEIEKA